MKKNVNNINRRTFVAQISRGATASILARAAISAEQQGHGAPSGRTVTLRPQDNGRALINPEMGWTMHFYSNIIDNYGSKLAPSDTLDDFPGLSTVYLRIPWSFIEIDEGRFNWEILDTPAQRWIGKGKKVAFRITASESWMRFATPEWVQKAGARGYNWGNTGQFWEPAYDDPIFLQKVDHFVAAMADRYDHNPHVAFVDVGHFGLWGEGHTVATTRIDYSLEVLKTHIDIYCRHFKNTLLCISDDFAGHDKPGQRFPITDYAFSRGVTLRDDSILVQPPPRSWFHAEMAQLFWPELPVILEHEHYGLSVGRKAWSQALLLQAVEEYHASYLSIHWWPRILLAENREIIDKINLRLGYRIQLSQISYPKEIEPGKAFRIESSLANAGVAPCYPGGYLCFTLKDKKDGVVAVLVDEQFNVRDLPVGTGQDAPVKNIISEFTVSSAFRDPIQTFFRKVEPGEYLLYFSVGKKDGTPVLELPLDGHDGARRFKLGEIVLLPRSADDR